VNFEDRTPPATVPAADDVMRSGRRVPGQSVACGWCGKLIPIRATGRLPKWRSRTCRQRAWEAATSAGRSDRPVEIVSRYLRAVPDNPADWVVQLDHLIRQMRSSDGDEWAIHQAELAAALEEASELIIRVPLHARRDVGWDY